MIWRLMPRKRIWAESPTRRSVTDSSQSSISSLFAKWSKADFMTVPRSNRQQTSLGILICILEHPTIPKPISSKKSASRPGYEFRGSDFFCRIFKCSRTAVNNSIFGPDRNSAKKFGHLFSACFSNTGTKNRTPTQKTKFGKYFPMPTQKNRQGFPGDGNKKIGKVFGGQQPKNSATFPGPKR